MSVGSGAAGVSFSPPLFLLAVVSVWCMIEASCTQTESLLFLIPIYFFLFSFLLLFLIAHFRLDIFLSFMYGG